MPSSMILYGLLQENGCCAHTNYQLENLVTFSLTAPEAFPGDGLGIASFSSISGGPPA